MKMNLLFSFFMASVLLAAAQEPDASGLSSSHYDNTCPDVETIIRYDVSQKLLEAQNAPAAALRIFFHDCFVEGCDASILITSHKAERDADINLSLPEDGFDVFFRAKRAVERQCPGVVSCADVMTIATRDLVHLAGGPTWEVLKGRKDGLISEASRVGGNLPRANQSLSEIVSLFHSKGLSTRDMAALFGAHTIGFSGCHEFASRLYNSSGATQTDPTMDPAFARTLRDVCPSLDSPASTFNDAASPFIFDNAHYGNLEKRRGLLASDQAMAGATATRGYVKAMAGDEKKFFNYFVEAMKKMSLIGIKTGRAGEIRRDCGAFND